VGDSTNKFSWQFGTDTYFSPGLVNDGQFFVVTTDATGAPIILIYSMWMNSTNIWIECSGTNNWIPTLVYSTNLLDTAGWSYEPTASSSSLSASNTYTIRFDRTNRPASFYQVVATNAP
jgi:hypothetical protein